MRAAGARNPSHPKVLIERTGAGCRLRLIPSPASASRGDLSQRRGSSLCDFKQSRRAHAAANAHGADDIFRAAALAFD